MRKNPWADRKTRAAILRGIRRAARKRAQRRAYMRAAKQELALGYMITRRAIEGRGG
jgi:hypothetical protein